MVDDLQEGIANVTGWSLNIAIGLQVLLGALTTGVAAATSGRHVRLTNFHTPHTTQANPNHISYSHNRHP